MPETTLEPQTETDLKSLAQDIVSRATSSGATAAECVIREGDEFSTLVRLGQVETLKESGSKAIGVRVFFGKRSASTYSSDFSRSGLDRMVSSALELAKITSEDPNAAFPNRRNSVPSQAISIFIRRMLFAAGQERIAYARRAEKAALDADSRIKNSDGGSFDAATGHKILANSHGFVGEYRRSYCSVAAVPIAQDDKGAMQRDYWFSVARSLNLLESPEEVGKIAAHRALRRLGARKVKKPQHVPVIFDPLVATSILEHIFEGVNGDSVYRGASFLAGKLGQSIASPKVIVIDDGTMKGGFGTSPFDGEGVPTRRTMVIDKGVLTSYLLNTYSAKKLGLQTTGNASRGLAGTPGIGPGNYFLQPGNKTPQQLIAEVKDGLYVTEFLGMGVNLVTGDYSRGASGLWISGGELAYPVEEITVAGNLKEMFMNISEVGNDLEFRGAVAAPTIRIDGLTVGGE